MLQLYHVCIVCCETICDTPQPGNQEQGWGDIQWVHCTVSQNSIPNKKEIRNQGYNYQDITKFGGLGKLKKKCLLRACSAQIQTRNSRKIVKKKSCQRC